MAGKIILLDVDGTIYTHSGVIPSSTKEAVREAQKNGHSVLLCTGRSKGEIGEELLRLSLDGMIGSAGAYIEYRGRVLFHRPMTETSVTRVLSFLQEEGIPFVLETNEAIYGPESGMEYVWQIIRNRLEQNPNLAPDFLGRQVVTEKDYPLSEVNKILFFDAPYRFEEMKEWLTPDYTFVPNAVAAFGTCSGEISEPGMTKAKGIEILLEQLSLDREDTIALGDGVNDMEMISFAKLGIAMGNAVKELKAAADDVTASVDEDGIYKAFVKYGLI